MAEHEHKPEELFIVGIGSSAGGVVALQELLEHASCHKNMCFVIVTHLSRFTDSQLDLILSRTTNLEAVFIEDDMPVERCKLFVLPPNHYVKIHGRRLKLEPRPAKGPNQAVTVFFESLAHDVGSCAIGVVLSGAAVGEDGAQGVVAIKQRGGHTYAQDPQTAEFPAMPRLAIATGCVDSVMIPRMIGEELSVISLT